MRDSNRREFLADVGRGMFVASLGSAVAADLGLSPAWAGEEAKRLEFGKLEPLVCLMQETAPGKLMPTLVEKLRDGTDLQTLVSAAALARVSASRRSFSALVWARAAASIQASAASVPLPTNVTMTTAGSDSSIGRILSTRSGHRKKSHSRLVDIGA